ncbi:hypothetical protein ACQF36_29420 [Streptomyces sp. Marseille-Q5077]
MGRTWRLRVRRARQVACLPAESYGGGEDEAAEDVAGDVVHEEGPQK